MNAILKMRKTSFYQYLFLLIFLLTLGSNISLSAQSSSSDQARYTPEWIRDSFKTEKDHMDQAAKAAAIAHKYGMKVDTYIQWNTMAYETFFAEVPEAKDDTWYQVDVNGKPILLTYGFQQSFRYRPSFNHEGYMEYFKEKIIRYAVEKFKDPALPAVPRIESVVSNEIQAHQHDSSVIWHQNLNVGL